MRDFLIDYLTVKHANNGSRAYHASRLLEYFSHRVPVDDGREHVQPLLHDIEVAEQTLEELKDAD